ncbi:GHKL domain-containing protein [Pseudobutyrivibrio sp. NOR37]|uniref:GHKL domain-containing protein n=1 Tax=Pseudobutyrivibrio xylanivorans TaxID=185007 RepID=A0A6M0LM83_PSEXY|nr:GHKL domain-containing protein [Pseudobutyrivibrio xylanivorans]SFR73090.1 GHKL domain-containing protein [Pseudobutyrivibrio sp. NOR37]
MTNYVALFSGVLLAFCQVLIVRKCMGVLLGSEKKDIVSNILWVLYYIYVATTMNIFSFRGTYLLIGNMLFVFTIAIVTKKASLLMKIFSVIVIFTIWTTVESLIGITIESIGISYIVSERVADFLSQMSVLLIVITIEKYKKDRFSKDISLKTFIMLAWIPVVSIYFEIVSVEVSRKYPNYDGFAAIASVVLLLTNYVIFDAYDWVNRTVQLRAQNKLFVQQIQLCSRQTAEQEATYKELRRLRHDMKNHLTSLLGMIDSGSTNDARDYIENLLNDGKLIKTGDISRTGNIVVDSLINYKYSMAKELGIEFTSNVFIPTELPFKNENIVIILGNLLENAIEACVKVDNNKYIGLEMGYEKNMLQICIKNSFTGEIKKNSAGDIETTKEDKENHGMGILSIKMAAKEYDGDVLIKNQKDEFTVVVVLYENMEKLHVNC